MRKILFLLAAVCGMSIAHAQTTLTFVAKTGDTELDANLTSINSQGSADFTLFKKDMSVSFGVTEAKVDYLRITVKMSPGDIYMTLELSKITGKSVDEVVKVYNANKGQGWGVIAKQLGIKPGSKEFHALKANAKGKNDKMKAKKAKGNTSPANPSKTNNPGSKGKGK